MNPELARSAVGAAAAHLAANFPIPTTVKILRSAGVVGIVGSRHYPELDRVDKLIAHLAADTIIISGGAQGVDDRAASAALASYRPCIVLKPMGLDKQLWTRAALARNGHIALCADVVTAFWDGESPGTADTIRKALKTSGKCIVALPGQAPEVWVLNF